MAYASAMDALGDPTRRRIFELLRAGPRAVGELAGELPVSRPAVSQHLRVLKEAGLVIQKSAVVAAPPEKAFEVFTEGIATWWPIETHSVQAMDKDSGAPETVIFETGPGGRVYERMTNGEEAHWANVIAWEPPHRLVLEWKVNPDAVAPTEIEVRFTPEGDGTRVDLEHRGFEALGKDAEEAHADYSGGWPTVFRDYVETVGK